MAKVTFTKLGLVKKDKDIKTFEWNEQIVEVKQYLPIQEKLELITRVINKALDASGKYYNIGQLTVILDLEIVYAYTNITFTDKQKEDFLKTYDLMVSNGFLDAVMFNIQPEELQTVEDWTCDSLKHVYEYNQSISGMLENVQQNRDMLNLDAEEIRQKLADPDNLALLKEIAPLMNLA